MRIVTWNLNGNGADKVPVAVERLQPDVLIAAECTDPATFDVGASSGAFVGAAGKTGLACMGFGNHVVRLAESYDERLVRIAPIEVDGRLPFHLLAVWADNSSKQKRPAIEALETYRNWLSAPTTVVAGDFNDGPVWDQPGPLGWLAMVSTLHDLGLQLVTPPETPTFYMHRNPDLPYMLDHAFVAGGWNVDRVSVGAPGDWLELSDHVPVTIDLTPQ